MLIETLDRARCRGPLGLLQHLLDPGPRRRGGRRRPRRHAGGPAGRPGLRLEGRDARGVLVVHRADPRPGPAAQGANMILDDGGDATMLVHKGVECGGRRPGAPTTADGTSTEEFRSSSSVLGAARCRRTRRPLDHDRRRDQGRHRGDHHRRAPPLPDGRGGRAALPGDQRQRLGHQVQVRQHVRLPPLADRRHQPRHRRHDRRQGRGRLRLRRRRQGLRRVAARPGRPRHRHRDRPDLRAAGRDGRLPGRHARRRRRARPTSSSPPPATRTSSPPSTWRG